MTTILSGENIICKLVDESTCEEAHSMTCLAYELAGMNPDDDAWGFDNYKYDVIEAELLSNIEGAIDKAVNAMWEAVRAGKYDPR